MLTPALMLYVGFVIILALSGGASRANEFGQLVVRVASCVMIAALQFTPKTRQTKALRPAFALIFGSALLVVVQLIPLPPSWWTSLPGRQSFVDAAQIANLAQPWRPLNLTPDFGLNTLFSLAPPLAMTVLMLHLRDRDDAWLAMGIVLLAMVSALTGLAQVADGGANSLRLYAVTSETIPVGLFANRNHQAVLLAIALPFTAVWVAQQRERSGGKVGVVGATAAGSVAAMLMVMLILTGSRAGFLVGALAGAASIAFLYRSDGRRATVLRIAGWSAAAAVVFALAIALLARWPLLAERLSGDPLDDLRFKVLPYVVQLATIYFPAGSGFGSFDAAFRQAEPFALLGPEYLNHAHNDYLELAIEGGLPALLGGIAFMVLWVLKCREAWLAPAGSHRTIFARLGMVVTMLLFLASAVDYPLRTPTLSSIFLLGLCWMLLRPPARVTAPN